MNSSKRVMGVDYRQVLSSLGVFSSAFIITALSSIILTSISLSNAAELPTSNSDLDVSVSVTPVIAIRTLDNTATNEISALNFDITPAASGTRESQTTIVDVSTSNVSGYNLLMQSDYKNDGVYTTDLVHTNAEIATTLPGKIPTESLSTASTTSYWNYTKSWNEVLGPTGHTESFSSSALPTSSTNNQLIPAHNTPATIRNDVNMATASSKTNVDVNVNIAADKSSGGYKNRLVFTAVANPIPVDYTLTFNKNTEDTVDNFPAPITDTNVATSHAFTIPDTANITRSGYTFVGWSEDPNTRQGTGTGPDGLYVAGDTFTVIADDPSQPDYSQHGTGNATLYAVWALEYTYTLNYSCQSGATNCPATQSATTINASHIFTISSVAPTLDGYDFINYTDNGVGTGNTYNPGDAIALTSTANTKTLTANFELAFQCSANAICYAPNANDAYGTMDNQTIAFHTSSSNWQSIDNTPISSSAEVTLYAPNFARSGYGFAGWNTKADGTGAMFGPNQTLISSGSSQSVDQGGPFPVTLTPDMQSKISNEGLILYAQWIPSAGDMQNWTGCSAMNIGDVTALTDTRTDTINMNRTYATAKLVDGKCWMVENLRYTANATSSDSWDRNSRTTKFYNFDNTTLPDSTSNPISPNSEGHNRWQSYGNYYSWASAINSTTSYSANITTPAPGICPVGWRVPTAGSVSADYDYLRSLVESSTANIDFKAANTLRLYPNNFVFSGNYGTAYASNRGLSGQYWSSTSYSYGNLDANYLNLNTITASARGQGNKSNGYSVRCVLE